MTRPGISDSKLPTTDQERALADVAKAVYELWDHL